MSIIKLKNRILAPLKFYLADKVSHIRLHYETRINGKLSNINLGHSFTGGFLQGIYAKLNDNNANFTSSQSPWSDKDKHVTIGGGVTDLTNPPFAIDCPASNDNYGIVLSSDNTNPSPTTTTTASLIIHGNSANQLSYGVMTGTGLTVSGSQSSITLGRTFTNNSGGNVSVNKAYLVGLNVGDHTNDVLIMVENFDSTDVIPNGSPYSITLTITITT